MGLQVLLPKTERQLRQLATAVVASCPDMRQLARESAITLLNKHGLGNLDPDHVHLNRFNTAQSSPRTYSGWQHHDAPFQSFTLPQLVMHRFDAQDQDNSDLLSYLTGFYSDGPGQVAYDEHNEIAMAPQDVLEDFWALDFSSQFHRQLEAFWQQHADDYRLLAKVNFLSKVVETCAADQHSPLATYARRVANALTGLQLTSPTLGQLQQVQTPAAGYRVCTFDIGGHLASDILRIEMEDGYQLLYTPGEVEALHLFASRKDLYWWVLNTTNQADNRARFMGHFPLASHAEKSDSVGLNHMIDLLFFNWGGDDHQCLNQLDQTLPGDAFSHLRDAAHKRMSDDAHFALRSNSDLRKQLWIGYLEAFGKVFGPLAALDWPIALAVVGAGLADTGLNIDQAINGHTTGERRAAIVGAVFAAIDTLFNAAMLASAAATSAEAELGSLPDAPENGSAAVEELTTQESAAASAADIDAWVPEPFKPAEQIDVLSPFETNVIIHGEMGRGDLAGIIVQDGKFYVLIDNQPYQVRHVGEMNAWVVIDPRNPYSFYRNVPIRLDPEGQWHPLERPGLRGGMVPRRLLNLWGRNTPEASIQALPSTPYEVPVDLRPALKSAACAPGQERLLSGILMDFNPQIESNYVEFRKLRDKLAADARDYLASVETPARPGAVLLPKEASPKQIIRGVYEKSEGLVIGESHSHLGSKQFLIDNMSLLKREKVKVLYMEHLMTDFQQADLDLFNRSGTMTADLKRYIKNLDRGYGIDPSGRYSFENLVLAARKAGIRIQSIDCMASYRQAWDLPPSAVVRQQMMNFFAHEIIEADQATRGASKWIALVGNTHANTFEEVLGISELQGALGLRVEDIAVGRAGGIEVDPGRAIIDDDLSVRTIKGDLRLQVPIAAASASDDLLEVLLRNKGTFTLSNIDEQPTLIHRSKDGALKYTPIIQDGQMFYLNRSGWPWISGRRLASLIDLRKTLEHRGLHYVRY